MTTLYTVIYRTGGYLNAEWHKTVPVKTLDDANERKQELERMGYKSLVHETAKLKVIGLPVGYCSRCDGDGKCTNQGKECA